MEEQKILFADMYRLLNSIKEEVKILAKQIDTLLYKDEDWEHLSLTVNGIISEADVIKAMCAAMYENANEFLCNGPYMNESAHRTPLEGYITPDDANE